MNRTSKLIIVAQSFLIVLFFLYGYSQSVEATRQRSLAIEAQQLADKNATEARKQAELAKMAMMEAEKQREMAIKMYEESLKKKEK